MSDEANKYNQTVNQTVSSSSQSKIDHSVVKTTEQLVVTERSQSNSVKIQGTNYTVNQINTSDGLTFQIVPQERAMNEIELEKTTNEDHLKSLSPTMSGELNSTINVLNDALTMITEEVFVDVGSTMDYNQKPLTPGRDIEVIMNIVYQIILLIFRFLGTVRCIKQFSAKNVVHPKQNCLGGNISNGN